MTRPVFRFILGSYAVVGFVVAALIAWIVVDHRAQRARLDALERAGVTRRSGRSTGCDAP